MEMVEPPERTSGRKKTAPMLFINTPGEGML